MTEPQSPDDVLKFWDHGSNQKVAYYALREAIRQRDNLRAIMVSLAEETESLRGGHFSQIARIHTRLKMALATS